MAINKIFGEAVLESLKNYKNKYIDNFAMMFANEIKEEKEEEKRKQEEE